MKGHAFESWNYTVNGPGHEVRCSCGAVLPFLYADHDAQAVLRRHVAELPLTLLERQTDALERAASALELIASALEGRVIR